MTKNIDINENIIRKVAYFLYDKFELNHVKVSKYYTTTHDIFIFLVGFVFIFNNNLLHLILLLIIVSLDAFSIVVLHKCPLTGLEKKYLKKSSCDVRREKLKSLGILYNCDHEYENQIELLINSWLLISGKCLIILLLKTFNIKLMNYNNLYTTT